MKIFKFFYLFFVKLRMSLSLCHELAASPESLSLGGRII